MLQQTDTTPKIPFNSSNDTSEIIERRIISEDEDAGSYCDAVYESILVGSWRLSTLPFLFFVMSSVPIFYVLDLPLFIEALLLLCFIYKHFRLKKQSWVENLVIQNVKLSSALSQCNPKDELVEIHAKMAQEALAGWEKAESEVMSLKEELHDVKRRRMAGEEG
ncbi:hypothetical protein Vadar_034383 [Vaccinium darrowii]|uniref:Uncharacterized protein n=1 Tax=Vaccinium darrowii TaxID=229202 RepID=A0ACB7X700_9ERIC|nr:hypothetical protein Vadar_034383 [Vaccinium darrowii]